MDQEDVMEIYVPNIQLKQVTEVLDQEGVTYKVTGQASALVVEGKEIGEVTAVEAALLETEVPAFLEDNPRSLRAFRLPSGKKFILTDVDGNFDRLAQAPAGWER
jgi:hypothetical protein